VLQMLEFTWKAPVPLGQLLSLICGPFRTLANMTLDEKIRFGMIALSGASIVFATLGVHINPLDIVGGAGAG